MYRSTFRYEAGGGSFDAQWFACNEGAQNLDLPTAFGSSRFDPYQLLVPAVGEVWEYRTRPVVGHLAGWLKGKHHCGTDQQWAEGWPVGTPGIPTGPDGVPDCCTAPGDPAAYDYGFDYGFDS
jgi:hypothetical protein